jgi:hypothetical protein
MSMKNFKKLSIAFTIGVMLGLLFSVPTFAGLGKIAGMKQLEKPLLAHRFRSLVLRWVLPLMRKVNILF